MNSDLMILVVIIGLTFLFIFGLAATGGYPFRGPFRWSEVKKKETKTVTPKKKFVDNTHVLIKRCRARKRRAKDWPTVENPRWKQNQPKYDSESNSYKGAIYTEPPQIRDTSPLYEVEPHTGKKRKKRKKRKIRSFIPYDYFNYDVDNRKMIFYVNRDFFDHYSIRDGQQIMLSGSEQNYIVHVDSFKDDGNHYVITSKIKPPPPPSPRTEWRSLIEKWSPILE